MDTITSLKNKYSDPYVVIGGDFNKRNFNQAIRDFRDLRTVSTGPTRGGATLDIIATNQHSNIVHASTLPPIENEEGTQSDHRVVLVKIRMPRVTLIRSTRTRTIIEKREH